MIDRLRAHETLRAALEAADVAETVLGDEVAALRWPWQTPRHRAWPATPRSAIEAFRAALRATSDPEGLAGRLSNLGSALETKFEHTLNPDVLDEAVTTLRRAAEAAPPGSTSRPMVLSNLGIPLHSQYERTGDRAVLGEAVDALHAAVDAAPEDHPDLGMYLANLGSALQDRFEVTTHAPDARTARAAFDRAVQANAVATHPEPPALTPCPAGVRAPLQPHRPTGASPMPDPYTCPTTDRSPRAQNTTFDIRRHQRLGGNINEYHHSI